jgi:probable selenium-dependent hydroxylase accessory protein YqeC
MLGALGIRRGDVVAVAGAGGKTTLCYGLAAEARRQGWRVLVTATTHMGTLLPETTGPVFLESEGDTEAGLRSALAGGGRATLLGRRLREDKLSGVPPERVDRLAALADLVVVEADGARQRSLKTPAPHEPVIPDSAQQLVVLAALDALGEPLSEERVHRLELVLAATGRSAGEPVGEAELLAALRDPNGYASRGRRGLRRGVFLNKVESEAGWAAARRLAAALQPPYDYVAAGSARAARAERLA